MYVHGLLFKQHTDKNMFSLLKVHKELLKKKTPIVLQESRLLRGLGSLMLLGYLFYVPTTRICLDYLSEIRLIIKSKPRWIMYINNLGRSASAL